MILEAVTLAAARVAGGLGNEAADAVVVSGKAVEFGPKPSKLAAERATLYLVPAVRLEMLRWLVLFHSWLTNWL